MSSDLVISKLNDLADAESRVDALRMQKKELIDSVIPDEVKDDINGIEVEFDPAIEAAQEYANNVAKEAKRLIVEKGESIDGEFKKGVFYKGRSSWNGKLLEGYAVAHPEVLECRKIGKPYAVIKDK